MYKRFVALAGPSTPKAHLMVHLLHRASYFGRPADYATWEDEAINRWLKNCLRLCSQANFEVMGLFKTGEFLRARGRKRQLEHAE